MEAISNTSKTRWAARPKWQSTHFVSWGPLVRPKSSLLHFESGRLSRGSHPSRRRSECALEWVNSTTRMFNTPNAYLRSPSYLNGIWTSMKMSSLSTMPANQPLPPASGAGAPILSLNGPPGMVHRRWLMPLVGGFLLLDSLPSPRCPLTFG